MNEELDRRIATEVMGEPEPPITWPKGFRPSYSQLRPNWGWLITEQRWTPNRFSTDLDQVMRAVDKLYEEANGNMSLIPVELAYRAAFKSWYAMGLGVPMVEGRTHAEAVCRLLLALVGKEGE